MAMAAALAIKEKKLTEIEPSSSPAKQETLDYAKLMEKVNNNNHHVVPVGIFIVLFTLYITATALQRNYNSFFEKIDNTSPALEQPPTNSKGQEVMRHEQERQAMILSRLQGHENICYAMGIFTKELGTKLMPEIDDKMITKSYDAKQSKKPRKMLTSSVSGGMGKGTKVKNLENNKMKKKDTQKKSSTAEPIIYLFALVFIYLLLKAASDINQHYKSQNKSDKRLRRCSLQSYAQAHKQDRRASKDSPLRRKSRVFENRSISVDRFKLQVPIKENNDEILTLKSEILANLRKYTSLDEKPMNRPSYLPTSPPLSPFKGGISEFSKFSDIKPTLDFSSLNFNRRCSMPVTINYQPVPVISINPSRTLLRRTSMIGGSMSGLSMDVGDNTNNSGLMEPKRRVRMINRH